MIDLKNYSKYSKEYGFLSIEEIIDSPSSQKNRVAFITDHSTMYSAYEFIDKCNKNGIKPVIGVTINADCEDGKQREITIYANNKKGFSDLSKLMHKANIDKHNEKSFKISDVYELKGDVKVLIGRNFITDSSENDLAIAKNLSSLSRTGIYIGIPPMSTEYQNSVLGDNVNLINKLKTLGRFIKSPDKNFLAVNENRFKTPSSFKYVRMKAQKVAKKDRNFDTSIIKSTDFIATEEYVDKVRFPSSDPFNQVMIDNNESFSNSFDKYEIKVDNIYLPKSKETLKDVLRGRYQEFILKKLNETDFSSKEDRDAFKLKYDQRIVKEISIIEKLGFSDYFLIFDDFAKNNPDRNFVLRGSAISSLTTHILGLSNIDPVENGLLFERFLNENRTNLPDIDVETDDVKEVIAYMQEKYGYNKFVSLSTDSIMRAKSQIDCAFETIRTDIIETPFRGEEQRIMPNDEYMEMSKIIKNNFFSKDNTFSQELDTNEELKRYVASNRNASILANLALLYENQVTSINRVPASYAISPIDIDEIYSGFESIDRKDGFKYKTVELSKDNIEQLGMVKLDILSNKYLSKIIDFRNKYNTSVDFKNQDPNVYKMISNGFTSSINQIKSQTQSRLVRNVGVSDFKDVVNIIALIRPAVEIERRNEYQRNKNGSYKSVNNIGHIVDETYGIIIFDEQVMKIAQDFGGLSPDESDDFRGALKSNNIGKLSEFYKKMLENSSSNGVSKSDSSLIIGMLNDTAGKYTFSKAHSLAYTQLIYEQSFYKENYPAEYMSVFVNKSDVKGSEKDEYIRELGLRGVQILKVDVNRSDIDFKTRIQNGVKFVDYPIMLRNESFAKIIVEDRNKNGKFEDIFDLMERAVNAQLTKPIFEMTEAEKTKLKVNTISGINELTSTGALDRLVSDEVVSAIYKNLNPNAKRSNTISENKNEIIRTIIDVTITKNISKILNPLDSTDFEYGEIKDVQKTKNLVDYEKNFYGGNIDFIKDGVQSNQRRTNNYRR